MSNKRVYGIDLGTTYSCIAHVDEHGKPVVLSNSEGDLTTPSVVYFEGAEEIVVGQAAKDISSVEPESCVSTVKRVMGDPNWEFSCYEKTYKAQDISSFILRKVVRDAELATGEKIEDVVITCPAYFGVNEKLATQQAGILAGLNVLYVIPEPTAAALAYGIEQDQNQVVLVYDLGGGTFDVSLIEIKDKEINVICTGGDHQLGGKNWDDAIVSYLADAFEKEHGTTADELMEDMETYQELLNAAERIKKTLSNRKSVTEPVRFAGKRAKVEITREVFDEITRSFLDRTLSLTESEIDKAKGKGFASIDKLLLVGGSTYMPQVMEAIKERFSLDILQFDPNQAVAKGAAIFGFKCHLDQQIKAKVAEKTGQSEESIDLAIGGKVVEDALQEVAESHGLALPGLKKLVEKRITNVSSKSFGIKVIDPNRGKEVVANMIYVDDKVPVTVSQKFGTHDDNQSEAELVCMENQEPEGNRVVEMDVCREIGKAILKFNKPMPRNSPVEITFSLGADGLLSLKGKDLTDNVEIDAVFETESVMSTTEVETSKSRNLAIVVS